MSTSRADAANPLLAHGGLPAFDRIETEHIVPGLRSLLEDLRCDLEALEGAIDPTWEGLVEPLFVLSEIRQGLIEQFPSLNECFLRAVDAMLFGFVCVLVLEKRDSHRELDRWNHRRV